MMQNILETIGPTGLGIGLLSLLGMLLKVWAWRRRAQDLREHQARLASAATEEQRAIIRSNPPPDLPDQIFKVLVVALLSGLALACSEPAYKLVAARGQGPASLCRPRCRSDEVCEGRICTKMARPAPKEEAASAPSPSSPVGPQSSTEPVLANQRWTDGKDPFESELCQ
jgi:hypothetical protein